MIAVIIRQPNGSEVTVQAAYNQNLLSLLRTHNVFLPSPCGGKGICGKCKVGIITGDETLKAPYVNTRAVSPAEWAKGIRLSCRLRVTEPLTVMIPEQQMEAEILTAGSRQTALDPFVSKRCVTLKPPDLSDQTGDADRLEQALHPAVIHDPRLLVQLPHTLRQNNFKVTAAVMGNSILAVEGGDTEADCYGVALDIGTTTMVGVLVNLTTGREECVYSCLNPQKIHGDDVISRIDYTIEDAGGLDRLKELLVEEIHRMLRHFTEQTGIPSASIYQMVVVGNTVMLHLFAGLPVENIAVSPFIPAVSRSFEMGSDALGLPINWGGRITLVPMIAGYIGADTVAAVLASNMAESSRCSLLIDIGTNGEIALGSRERILACSTAAGPAFEGGHIRYGLGGVGGAINRIELEDDRVLYTTIGDRPARGICGSGVVDAAAQLLKSKLLEPYGRMITREEALGAAPSLAHRIMDVDGKPAFLLVSSQEGAREDILITQKDIREIQLAKGAIAAGIHILMQEMGIGMDDIEHVYLSGGFGNYIDYDHAVDIGLIPRELRSRIVPIGNGALAGARMILTSRICRQQAESIRSIMEYIELSSRLDFQTLFVDYMEFSQCL